MNFIIELSTAFHSVHISFAYSSLPGRKRMGGERASKTRQRLAGKICCKCPRFLSAPPERPGERFCDRCEPRPHAVVMQFDHHDEGYTVYFSRDETRPGVGWPGPMIGPRYCNVSKERLSEVFLRTFPSPEAKEKFHQCFAVWHRGTIRLQLTEREWVALHNPRRVVK